MTTGARIYRTGELVSIGCGGRVVDGAVIFASGNGKSLVLGFEALLDGHLGMMPVSMEDSGKFVALFTGRPVTLTARSQ